MTNKIDFIHISWVVIENQLSCEVVITRILRVEFEADDAEGLAVD